MSGFRSFWWIPGRRRGGPAGEDARGRFFADAAQFTQVVSVDSDGLLVLTSTSEQSDFFATRTRTELSVLKKALAILENAKCHFRRTTFVDAGAYIGTTTLNALKAGFSCAVACEPEPRNARLLRANVALNGAEASVRVCEVALSNETGTATLAVGRSRRSKSRLLCGPADEAKGKKVEVATARLDDLAVDGVFDPAEVGLFWLDAEGYEYRILEGATTVLERSPPVVMELYPKLLGRAGGAAPLPDLLAQHYTHVADLRSPESQLEPVKLVSELLERYRSSKTDLLLYRPSASPSRR